MKKLRMLWASLCVMALTALCAVPAWADLIIVDPDKVKPMPEPAPETAGPDTALIVGLAAAAVLIAAAVIAWTVARRRRGASK